jgi:hypothetical protein
MKIFTALCVGHEHHLSAQKTDHIDAQLTVSQPRILFGNHWAVKNGFASNEIQSVFANVTLPFTFVPGNHNQIALTNTVQGKQIVNTVSEFKSEVQLYD